MTRLIDLQSIPDTARGTLVVMEAGRQVPFEFSRVFMLVGVEEGTRRGDHAHREQHQLLIAVAGKFKIAVEDRGGRTECILDSPSVGLHVPPLTWLTIWSMAPRSTCMVLASTLFDEGDYIRDHGEFERLVRV